MLGEGNGGCQKCIDRQGVGDPGRRSNQELVSPPLLLKTAARKLLSPLPGAVTARLSWSSSRATTACYDPSPFAS
jgi:hypothetical protein